MADYLIPLTLLAVALAGLRKREDVYCLLTEGAADGLRLLARIVPSLVVLLTAVSMLRASGAIDLLTAFLAPVFGFFGVPPETAPLMLIRPFSGSAALAVGAEIMSKYGADSAVGRTAAVMLGSTETTFYTISVYFGAAKVRGTRYAVPAAIFADLVGFFTAALTVRLLY
ncbi:MAG: spore maturation protein [Oscillospiraceae bacterium]|nr:spore maturation protein [Oscillospiraceae bacterium]